jgi:tetratricopeptide (TPR) repeat protein
MPYESMKEESMRIKNRKIHKNIFYLLGFSIIFLLTSTATSAKTVAYTKEYTYQASDADSKLSCRTIALQQVKRLLLEELGTYLFSETAVKNFELTKDQISSLTAGIVMTVILEEKWDGKDYFLKAKISADTDELIKSIDHVRGNREQSKEWEEMKKKTEEALKEIEKLKKEIVNDTGNKVIEEKYAKAVNELNAIDWFKKGYVLKFRDKNNQDAIKAFDKAIEMDPNYAPAYAGRAAIYNERGQFQEALRESEQAIKLNSKHPWGINCRGNAYIGLRNYQKAIEDFDRAIELEPSHPWSYVNRSRVYFFRAKYHQAYEDANKAIEIDPGLSYAYLHRGKALASLNKIQDAIKDFDKSIELDPNLSWSFLHRGFALLKLNKTEQGLEDIKRAASLGNIKAKGYLRKKGK